MSCTQSRAWAPEKTKMALRPSRAPTGPGTDTGRGGGGAEPCVPGQEGSHSLPSLCVPGCQVLPGASLSAAPRPEASAASVSPEEGERSVIMGIRAPLVCPSRDSSSTHGLLFHQLKKDEWAFLAKALDPERSRETEPLALEPCGTLGVPSALSGSFSWARAGVRTHPPPSTHIELPGLQKNAHPSLASSTRPREATCPSERADAGEPCSLSSVKSSPSSFRSGSQDASSGTP